MEFGFTIPTRGPLSTRQGISEIVRKGEALGFTHGTVSDHIVVPRDVASRYPYSDSGEWPGGRVGEHLEQLSLLSFLAGVTETLRLVTAIMVVPYRNPILTAKALATADVLSEGRITVGCGAGWMEEEFEALDTPPFAERGRVTDEFLRIFKTIWTEDSPEFAGDYSRFSNVSVLPHPEQKPHPPLWIGGESAPALRRTARLGDGWFPIGNNPRFPLNTVALYRAALDRLHGLIEAEGRDPATVALGYSANWVYGRDALTLPDGARHAFTGSADQLLEDIDAFGALGLRHLIVNFQSSDLNATIERMEGFAEDVMRKS